MLKVFLLINNILIKEIKNWKAFILVNVVILIINHGDKTIIRMNICYTYYLLHQTNICQKYLYQLILSS